MYIYIHILLIYANYKRTVHDYAMTLYMGLGNHESVYVYIVSTTNRNALISIIIVFFCLSDYTATTVPYRSSMSNVGSSNPISNYNLPQLQGLNVCIDTWLHMYLLCVYWAINHLQIGMHIGSRRGFYVSIHVWAATASCVNSEVRTHSNWVYHSLFNLSCHFRIHTHVRGYTNKTRQIGLE